MSRNDPDWLNAQYNNRARVPDHARHPGPLGRGLGADARRSSDCRLDLRYGDGPQESAGPVSAAARPGAPVLVFVHGGYWRALDKSDFSFVAPVVHRRPGRWWWCRTMRCARR